MSPHRIRPLHLPPRILWSLALVVAISLVVSAGAQAATLGTQGISTRPDKPAAEVASSLDAAKRSGAKLVRVEADWAALEPVSSGVRDADALAGLDRVVDGVAQRGMRTVLYINRTPCWASAAPAGERRGCEGPDANRAAVWRYRPSSSTSVVPIATFLAGRYATRLAAFQIWNEPDQSNEKYWAGPNKVKTYVAMVKALYRPLKRAAPKVPVLAGSFVGTNGEWLKAMYREGIRGHYDGLAVQFYATTLYGLRATRQVQRANRDTKPLWLTEFGYTSCYRRGGPAIQIDQPCVSREGQARGLTDVLTALRTRTWVKAAIPYTLYDDNPPGGYTFGLLDADGRIKPAWTAVRRVVRGTVRAPQRPTIRLRASSGRLVASGTASRAELLTVRVFRSGQLRLRATFTSDRLFRWRLALPASLGTRGMRVSISAGWTGSAVARR